MNTTKILLPWSTGTGNIVIETQGEVEFLSEPYQIPGFPDTFISNEDVIFIGTHTSFQISSDSLTGTQRQQILTFRSREETSLVKTLTVTQEAITLPNYKVNIKDISTLDGQTLNLGNALDTPNQAFNFGTIFGTSVDLSGFVITLYDHYGNQIGQQTSSATGITLFNSIAQKGPFSVKMVKGNEEMIYSKINFDSNNEFNIYVNFDV